MSFGTIRGSPTLAAAPMTTSEFSALATLPGFSDQALQGWDFTTNLVTASEVLLSFNIGEGYDPANLHIWHLSGGTWSAYSPAWETYSASGALDFPVTSFSGYAVTTSVPEPAALCGMVLGAVALLRRRTRFARKWN